MEKIILLVAFVSAILAMAQFPDWPHERPLASVEPGRPDYRFD